MTTATALSPEQLNTLQHALGLDQYGQAKERRNRFVSDPGDPVVDSLVLLGLMNDLGEWKITDGMHAYVVTDAGKAAVAEQSPAPPKVSRARKRYLAWLRWCDGWDMDFGYFLKHKLYDRDKADAWLDERAADRREFMASMGLS